MTPIEYVKQWKPGLPDYVIFAGAVINMAAIIAILAYYLIG